ncbi:transcriptional regulator [Mycobacterium antarcticum]|uniref:ArsR/SmtB family transcription factor n=1 Tax=unclassified Mycolicibacterium TaxID=2636767 RepID=UPI0023A247AE|nr:MULTISPECIES: metalloregulator ArsR/SmtB family transcription factor [unclassified Mycolicibacterium]BDX32337.1 transcriptional regulator [Mycolicibacterium sp. TUM20985]GLP84117.1 transcriptional regulator [Mycolicibacterium sp. TUM20984]
MAEPPIEHCDLLCLDLPHAERIRGLLPSSAEAELLAVAARALSDPTRLIIASALLRGDELCVCDMAWVVGHSQNLVSHHLRQLKIAGLVTSRRQARMVMYQLTDRGRSLTEAVFGTVGRRPHREAPHV